jgi:hypothetical protein
MWVITPDGELVNLAECVEIYRQDFGGQNLATIIAEDGRGARRHLTDEIERDDVDKILRELARELNAVLGRLSCKTAAHS